MKKTLHIDEQMLRDAKAASGAITHTETVRLGLESLIRRAAYERLRKLRCREGVKRRAEAQGGVAHKEDARINGAGRHLCVDPLSR